MFKSAGNMARRFYQMVLSSAAALVVLAAAAPLHAQEFVKFSDFVQSLKAADVDAILSLTTTKATDAASVAEMRQQLVALYDGVDVTQTYVVGTQTIDCIPIMQQPAVRILGLTSIAEPPPAPATPPGMASKALVLPSQLPAGETRDAFGNSLGCQDGTIPMTRVTLEQMAHFKTFGIIFRQGPRRGWAGKRAGRRSPGDSCTQVCVLRPGREQPRR